MNSQTISISPPAGPWEIVRALGDNSWLAMDQGRQVVIKPLDGSCLRGDKLRDGVRERLMRIRQLPQISMANLLGVEKTDTAAWCLWEYVPGESIQQWSIRSSEDQLLRLARELVLAVLQMHSLGIVHGAIHGRNIIISDRGLRLTHASPLMWTDPSRDQQAVLQVLEDSAQSCNSSRLIHWVNLARQQDWPLEELARKLMAADQSPAEVEDILPLPHHDRLVRLKTIVAILGVLMVGAVVSGLFWQWTHQADQRLGTPARDLRQDQSPESLQGLPPNHPADDADAITPSADQPSSLAPIPSGQSIANGLQRMGGRS